MIPVKPFDSYKWRWLSVTPSEGLILPSVYLGVLRALAKFESKSPTDINLLKELATVQNETGTSVDLVRTPERNLVRNSGQYWKGTGLLLPTKGVIELSALGRNVASGKITQGEFAAIMVQQTVLPNPFTFSDEEIKKWDDLGLKIKPLELILKILDRLGLEHGKENAYITPNELMKIIIPLAGNKSQDSDYTNTIIQYREGVLNLAGWPDCTPDANDKRMAREFLLFLEHYGLCNVQKGSHRYEERFFLSELFEESSIYADTDESIFEEDVVIEEIILATRNSGLPSIIERQRTISSIISRPSQAKFRKNVLEAFSNTCLLTGEKISETLEAAHIIPVNDGGDDVVENGLCLRVDIHRLFDSGNLRILPGGKLLLSDTVNGSVNYKQLPKDIPIPSFINMTNLEWREKYC